jgi:thiol:disulfide interchange protein
MGARENRMKKTGLFLILTLLLLTSVVTTGCERKDVSAPVAVTAGGVTWERDFGTALTRASKERKIVMVDFYADWCGWCKRLDKNTFGDSRVQQALTRLVPLKLNAEKEGREHASRYRVEGFPTIVFLDNRGNEVARIPGYMDAGPFLEELEDILKRA